MSGASSARTPPMMASIAAAGRVMEPRDTGRSGRASMAPSARRLSRTIGAAFSVDRLGCFSFLILALICVSCATPDRSLTAPSSFISNTEVEGMAHVSNTGTISVNPSSVLALGGTVTFTVTFSPSNLDSKFSRNGGVQIILEASRPVTSGPPGDVTYRDTKHYDQPFVLGQGGENTGTAWRDVGGPMHMR